MAPTTCGRISGIVEQHIVYGLVINYFRSTIVNELCQSGEIRFELFVMIFFCY